MKNVLIYIAIMALLGSCTKGIQEQGGGETAPGTVQVQLVVPTGEQNKSNSRAAIPGTAAENFIGNVQMLFWETGENSIGRYLYIDPKKPVVDVGTVWNPATGTLAIRNSGFRDCVIYVMVNGKGDELSKEFKTQAEILDVIAEHSGAIIDPATHPLPMSGISPMVDFNDENTTQVTVELHRMVAKVNVTVNLDANFLKAYPDCVFGTAAGQEAALKLVNIPSKSYVFQKTPIMIPSTAVDANNISDMPVKENGTGKDMTWTTTAYVFENPTADPATSMKIGLYLPYKDGTNPAVTSNYYQLLEVNQTATTDRVKRNWIYNMTVTVNGFGKENVTVNTIVEPWNVENIDTDVQGQTIKPNKSTVELLDENMSTELIVAYSGTAPLTITPDIPARFTSITRDVATGVVTLKAKHDGSATSNPDFATLTISNGDTRLDRTVKVKYTPITVTGLPTARQDISDVSNEVALKGVTISHASEVVYGWEGDLSAFYSDNTLTVTTLLNQDGYIQTPELWRIYVRAKNGRIIQTINFRYEPLCWASGDIVLSADNKYVIGESISQRTLIFQGGSKYGILSTEPTSWFAPATKPYYIPSSVGGAVTSGAAVTFTAFSTISHASGQGLGDPCAYIGGAEKWKSPSAEEMDKLFDGDFASGGRGGKASKTIGGQQIRGWQFSTYDIFFPWDYATGRLMGPIDQVGSEAKRLMGNRWSNTKHATDATYLSIVCDDFNNGTVPMFLWNDELILLPVRCVRDFTGVEPTE